MDRRENDQWLDEALSETIGSKETRVDFEAWKQKHPQAVEMLTSRAGKEASPGPVTIRRIIVKSPITKLVAAAVIIIALVVGMSHFGGSVESVAWADIAERFESVPFVHVTTYVSWGPYAEDQEMETHKIETWKSENSRIRAHLRKEVIFAGFVDGNNVVVGFDSSSRQPLNADRMAKLTNAVSHGFLHAGEGEFSLETLMRRSSSEDTEIISVESADTAASREIVLFEVKREKASSLRSWIWALRKSKLPIRACYRDPKHKVYADLLFDYSEKKDAEFFDPNAFIGQ
ncbi:MAG: hypothetical protein ACYTEK_12610 [Planctomycetota bacterium]